VDVDGGQAAATVESESFDEVQGGGEFQGTQADAREESIVTDAGEAGGEPH
jgi:hypothetical protein